MPNIPAIETRYKGFFFRSRIEARWAVFMDVLGIKYDYEPDKFVTSGGPYIPDFWLPEFGDNFNKDLRAVGLFLEIKGPAPTDDEIAKAQDLAEGTGKQCVIAYGSGFDSALDCCSGFGSRGAYAAFPCQCPLCGSFGFGGADGELRHTHSHVCFGECAIAEKYDILDHFNQDYQNPGNSPSISIAREAARSARFESAEWINSLDGIVLSVKRLTEQGVFCTLGEYSKILSRAHEWAAEKPTTPYMKYDPPWWVQHRANAKSGHLCGCYRCINEVKTIVMAEA